MHKDVNLPDYKTNGSSGMDVRAYFEEGSGVLIRPRERVLIHTGLKVEIPLGYEIQVRSRSGMAIKNGVFVLNSPGTIDSDYRGECCVILYNSDNTEDFFVKNGDRIAQFVLAPVSRALIKEIPFVDETERGSGGFGSTGML
jgi:dUTP pyrophosphatase